MDYLESIELAMRNEKSEMEFYLNEASRSKNELAKKMFTTLANDEKEHMQRIKKLHDRLVAEGSWPADVPIEVAGTDIKQVLDNLATKVGSKTDHEDDDIQALKKAAEFESKGAAFYSDLAQTCDNQMEKNFFEFLAKIEREHQLSITDSLAFLEDPETWMMQHERSGLDGA